LQHQRANVSLLIIDELGFVPLSKTGAEPLFEEWTQTFGTQRLTGALLDRLTHHVNILEMNGESYRLNQSRSRLAKT
jgi:DNA replication protein DnaC